MRFRVIVGEQTNCSPASHVHRGVTLEKGVKYIATTWICFA
jgi:hypothetical protein